MNNTMFKKGLVSLAAAGLLATVASANTGTVTTTTTDFRVNLDKTVEAGNAANIVVELLNANGNVDLFSETGDVVQSYLSVASAMGKVSATNGSAGTNGNDISATGHIFKDTGTGASSRIVNTENGKAGFSIYYEKAGKDTIQISAVMCGDATCTKKTVLPAKTYEVEILPSPNKATRIEILDIGVITSTDTDETTYDSNGTKSGKVTIKAGNQISLQLRAFDGDAVTDYQNGPVKVVFDYGNDYGVTGTGTTAGSEPENATYNYVAEGTMSDGQLVMTVPAEVLTKASSSGNGTYGIMVAFEGKSVGTNNKWVTGRKSKDTAGTTLHTIDGVAYTTSSAFNLDANITVKPTAPSQIKASLVNSSGNSVTSLWAQESSTVAPRVRFRMADKYGNELIPGIHTAADFGEATYKVSATGPSYAGSNGSLGDDLTLSKTAMEVNSTNLGTLDSTKLNAAYTKGMTTASLSFTSSSSTPLVSSTLSLPIYEKKLFTYLRDVDLTAGTVERATAQTTDGTGLGGVVLPATYASSGNPIFTYTCTSTTGFPIAEVNVTATGGAKAPWSSSIFLDGNATNTGGADTNLTIRFLVNPNGDDNTTKVATVQLKDRNSTTAVGGLITLYDNNVTGDGNYTITMRSTATTGAVSADVNTSICTATPINAKTVTLAVNNPALNSAATNYNIESVTTTTDAYGNIDLRLTKATVSGNENVVVSYAGTDTNYAPSNYDKNITVSAADASKISVYGYNSTTKATYELSATDTVTLDRKDDKNLTIYTDSTTLSAANQIKVALADTYGNAISTATNSINIASDADANNIDPLYYINSGPNCTNTAYAGAYSQNIGTNGCLHYNKDGNDTITFTGSYVTPFTMKLAVTDTTSKLTSIDMIPTSDYILTNGEIPMLVKAKNQAGALMSASNVKVIYENPVLLNDNSLRTNERNVSIGTDASISSSGEVYSLQAGNTPGTLKVTLQNLDGSVKTTREFTVVSTTADITSEPATVTLDVASALNMTVGDTQAVVATVKDENGVALANQTVTVISSDSSKVTVSPSTGVTDASGQVSVTLTAVSSGSSTIAIKTANGISGTTVATIAAASSSSSSSSDSSSSDSSSSDSSDSSDSSSSSSEAAKATTPALVAGWNLIGNHSGSEIADPKTTIGASLAWTYDSANAWGAEGRAVPSCAGFWVKVDEAKAGVELGEAASECAKPTVGEWSLNVATSATTVGDLATETGASLLWVYDASAPAWKAITDTSYAISVGQGYWAK